MDKFSLLHNCRSLLRMDAHGSLLLLATKEISEVVPSTQDLVQKNGSVCRKTNTIQLKVAPLQCSLHGSTDDDYKLGLDIASTCALYYLPGTPATSMFRESLKSTWFSTQILAPETVIRPKRMIERPPNTPSGMVWIAAPNF